MARTGGPVSGRRRGRRGGRCLGPDGLDPALLLDNPSVLAEDATPARASAGALSVALTGAVLLLLDASYPPTGATTLIVSLGFVLMLCAVGIFSYFIASIASVLVGIDSQKPSEEPGQGDGSVRLDAEETATLRRILDRAGEGQPSATQEPTADS